MDEGENIETNESFVEIQAAAGMASSGYHYPNQMQMGALDYTYTASSQLNQSHQLGASHLSQAQDSSALGSHSGVLMPAQRASAKQSQTVRRSPVILPQQPGTAVPRGPMAMEQHQVHQQALSQQQRGRGGQSAQGVRNTQVVDLPNQPERAQAASPQAAAFLSLSRLQTNLSDTQKMKANNPFRKENAAQVRQDTQEYERLRSTLAHTQAHTQQQTTQGGPFDFTKSALGLTHRLLQAFTSPSPSAQGHSQRQTSPNNFQFNNPTSHRNHQLGATTPIRFPGAFPSGQTVETQQSRTSMNRYPIKRHGSPQLTDPRVMTQPRALIGPAHGGQGRSLKKNIDRIIQNNIQESDLGRHARLCDKNKVDLGQNPILEEVTIQQRYDELDTKRAMQLQQQTTERLMFEKEKQSFHLRRMESEPSSESPLIRVARVESDSRSSLAEDSLAQDAVMGDQVQQTLSMLQSQSPFKELAEQNSAIVHRRQGRAPIGVYMNTLSSLDDKEGGAGQAGKANGPQAIGELDIGLEDIQVQGRHRKASDGGAKSKATRASLPPSASTTERQSMGAQRDWALSKTPSQAAEAERSIPVIQERSEEGEEPAKAQDLDEQHKLFNLLPSQHQTLTLGQQITQGMKKSQRRQNYKEQPSFIDSSHPSSSFDSINPADLVLATQTATSNYAPDASGTPATAGKFSKLQPMLQNGLYLQTRSSGYSSIYQVTRGDEEGNETDRQAASQITGNQDSGETGIESCLVKIDQNLNTFTTKQFEELREKVNTMGYYKAQIMAQQQFGLKQHKARVKGLSLSFISEDKREESQVAEHGLRVGPEEDESGLNRHLVLSSDSGSHTVLCSGFLSCPSILFDPYSSKPRHLATILDHRSDPPALGQYLPLKLLSIQSLVQLKRKCTMLSCGFEHCLALIDDQVWSWGCGGSGCLGHGDYKTVAEPRRVEGVREKAAYLEAGGYHNGVIAASSKGTHVYVWGRGDVGQLGLAPDQTTEDQKGQVLLEPAQLQFKKQIVQIALGDAHTLFLTQQGRVLSCGWHELGQLGVSQEKLQANQLAGILIHKVEIKDQATNEPIRIKQVTCGAVFSVALSVSGDIFAWGSNNNGQMGLGTETASDSSNRSSSKATQLNLPTKVELGRENASGQVKQVLAGDCHVLAADDAGIYAWGQGQILEEDSKSEKYFLDVICNQPVQIEAEIENEMYYQIDRSEEELLADESRDGPASAGQRTRQATDEDQSADQPPAARPFKKPLIVPPLALSEMKRKQERGNGGPFAQHVPQAHAHQSPQFTIAVPAVATGGGSNAGAVFGAGLLHQPQREGSQKTAKSRWPSSNEFDLVTIKNTDDYNNFIKNGSDNKRTDQESLQKFEKKLASYMLRDSSADESGRDTTTYREHKERSAGGYSDLIPIIEEEQFAPQGHLSKTQKQGGIQLIDRLKESKEEQALYSSHENQQKFGNMRSSLPDGETGKPGQFVDFLVSEYQGKAMEGEESADAPANAPRWNEVGTHPGQLVAPPRPSRPHATRDALTPQQLQQRMANSGHDHVDHPQEESKVEGSEAGIQVLDSGARPRQPVTATKVCQTVTTSDDKRTYSNGKLSLFHPRSDQKQPCQSANVAQYALSNQQAAGSGQKIASGRKRYQDDPVQVLHSEKKKKTEKTQQSHSARKKDGPTSKDTSDSQRGPRSKYNSAHKVQSARRDQRNQANQVAPIDRAGSKDGVAALPRRQPARENTAGVKLAKEESYDEKTELHTRAQVPSSVESNQLSAQLPHQRLDDNQASSYQNMVFSYPQNAISGGTGETGRNHHVDHHTSKPSADGPANLLSLRNKAEKVSRQPSPELRVLTGRKDVPVLMSSRPGSSARSGSPRSPTANSLRSTRDYMRKSPKHSQPKSISSKGPTGDRFNNTVYDLGGRDAFISNSKDSGAKGKTILHPTNPGGAGDGAETRPHAACMTLQDQEALRLNAGGTNDHSLMSRSSLAQNQLMSRESQFSNYQ